MSSSIVSDESLVLLTETQVAELLGTSLESVQQLRHTGRLHFENVGRGKVRSSWRIPRARVEAFALGTAHDPIEDALANPRPASRQVRKPRKQHI